MYNDRCGVGVTPQHAEIAVPPAIALNPQYWPMLYQARIRP
jgi:hypothetical protein